jgi:hypothetical protein
MDGVSPVWIGGKSLLIVLGDSIDKGYNSVGVIDLWMSLQDQAERMQGRIVHLLGNHEAEFISDPQDKKGKVFREEIQSKNISLKEFSNPTYPRARFLRSMPLAARVGNWMFSHSGNYPDQTWSDFSAKASKILSKGNFLDSFVLGPDSILEAKKWELNPTTRSQVESSLSESGFVGAVFGHQPDALKISGQCGTSKNHRLIKIDNGMAPQAGSNPGSILIFSNSQDLGATDSKSLNQMKIRAILPTGKWTPLAVEY